VVRPKKALYGLKQAPKAWFSLNAKGLREPGWTPCPSAEGLCRKPSQAVPGKWLKKSVYADDNIGKSPDKQEPDYKTNLILKKSPGRMLPVEKRVVDGKAFT